MIATGFAILFGYGVRKQPGRISRLEGEALLLVYAGYTAWLISTL